MKEQSLYESIQDLQRKDKTAWLTLINKFRPLILKLSKKLGTEDASSDFECELISIMLKINLIGFSSNCDAALLSYIKISMDNFYVSQSKKKGRNQKICDYSNLRDHELILVENAESSNKTEQDFLFDDLKKCLNSIEFEVIYQLYYMNLTVAEVASMRSCSRQSINQTKVRARKKMRIFYEGSK